MNRPGFTRRQNEIIDANLARPSEERFQALVDKGIIDEKGKVLVRMPYFGPDGVLDPVKETPGNAD